MDSDKQRPRLIATGAKRGRVSKLEPYAEQLQELEERGYSFRMLREALSEQQGVKVSRGTIQKFLSVRRKRVSAGLAGVTVTEQKQENAGGDDTARSAALEKIRLVAKTPERKAVAVKFKYSEAPLEFEE